VKHQLEFLEIMAINACNLRCQGCTTFSDLPHKGYVDWHDAKTWLTNWSARLDFDAIGIIGGEPLIHPQIRQFLIGIRELLPNTQLRFVTNGLLLDKHWDIVELLNSLGNSVLKISYHLADPRLDSIIDKILNSYDWSPITEYNINRWVNNSTGMRFQVNRPEVFLKTFKNDYHNMLPHDSDPIDAFEICVQKKCPILLDGKIWKCGTAALTPLILDRFKKSNSLEWAPFIVHGMTEDCSESELLDFVNNFGKPHTICRQCPTKADRQSHIDHLSTVEFKNTKATIK
jgi:hypothetical protein